MKYASIDIGTNTLRLLIAGAEGEGKIKPLIYERAITRLGGNYTEDKGIDRDSAERALKALESFASEIKKAGVDDVTAVATSVVRRARNREAFINEVFNRTGIKINVISGGEEARLALLGVLSVLKDGSGNRVVMDIGGGSTEFIFTKGNELKGSWSMEMGVVHLAEKHLKSDPPKESELRALEEEVASVIDGLRVGMEEGGVSPFDYCAEKDCVFVGTAGTITTLAALDQDLQIYDRDRINNYTLTRERIREMYGQLSGLKLREREAILSLEKGREDLIIPGSAITLIVMEAFGFKWMKVSDAGLLEGIIIDKARVRH